MKLVVTAAGHEFTVELPNPGAADQPPLVDGEPVVCDAVQLRPGHYSVLAGGRSYELWLERLTDAAGDAGHDDAAESLATVDGIGITLRVRDARRQAARQLGVGRAAPAGAATVVAVLAPMPGRVVAVPVVVGSRVEQGQTVVVLEAMKMESAIGAPHSGTISEVLTAAGQTVQPRQVLARIAG